MRLRLHMLNSTLFPTALAILLYPVPVVTAEEAHLDRWNTVVPFPVQPRVQLVSVGDLFHAWTRRVDSWSVVQPHWMVGILQDESSMAGSGYLVDPRGLVPKGGCRHTLGVVAVDVRDGNAKLLRRLPFRMRIHSVVPLGKGRCGAVIVPNFPTVGLLNYPQIVEWDLTTDDVSEPAGWIPLTLNPVVRSIDLNRVALDLEQRWSTDDQCEPVPARFTMRQASDGKQTSAPAPLYDYDSPHRLNRAGPTRWYAPTENGIGVIVFDAPSRSRQYYDRAQVTCYEPTAPEGVRWRLVSLLFKVHFCKVGDHKSVVAPDVFCWTKNFQNRIANPASTAAAE